MYIQCDPLESGTSPKFVFFVWFSLHFIIKIIKKNY